MEFPCLMSSLSSEFLISLCMTGSDTVSCNSFQCVLGCRDCFVCILAVGWSLWTTVRWPDSHSIGYITYFLIRNNNRFRSTFDRQSLNKSDEIFAFSKIFSPNISHFSILVTNQGPWEALDLHLRATWTAVAGLKSTASATEEAESLCLVPQLHFSLICLTSQSTAPAEALHRLLPNDDIGISYFQPSPVSVFYG